MSLPVTLKEERFLALPKDNFSKILSDDFIHNGNTVETIKLKSVTSTGSIVNYKTSSHFNNDKS